LNVLTAGAPTGQARAGEADNAGQCIPFGEALKNGDIVQFGARRKSPPHVLELVEQIRRERHAANRSDCDLVSCCIEATGSLISHGRNAKRPVGRLPHRGSARRTFGPRLLPLYLREEHRGQSSSAIDVENGSGWIRSMKEVVGQHRHERRTSEVVTSPQQCVTEAARMILRDELEVNRSLVVASHRFEHWLVRIGNDDGSKQAGIRRFVEGPVKHRFQTDREHLLRQPPGDRV
jgi:hypothetical protein